MGSLILIAYQAGWNGTLWRSAAVHNNASQGTPSASTSVARPAGAAAPVTLIPSSLSREAALAEMNCRFFLAHRWGGEAAIGYESADGVCAVTREGLRLMLANRFVTGTKNSVPLADWWLKDAQRREVDRVIYDPEGMLARSGERIFNLWTGFNLEPRPGLWSKMRRHLLDIVCKGDQKRFRYVLSWLAHAVQHPGTAPGTVLVLMSEAEGAGKTIVADWMVRILGRHGIMLSTPEHLVGDFNDHLENQSFVCLNEPAFPGDHAGARKFKSMITDATWLINGKYRKPYPVPNIAHIMLTTNAEWAVPAGNNARRFVVLDVDERRVGDHVYFASLRQEAKNGGIAAMLDFLRRLDISKCNLHAVPHTQALVNQQLLSANSQTQWALDAVIHGRLRVSFYGGIFGETHASRDLYQWYSEYTQHRGQRPIPGIAFGKWLGRCGFRRSTSSGSAHWDIPDAATFAAAVKRQAGIL
jgi:hypothetical protein